MIPIYYGVTASEVTPTSPTISSHKSPIFIRYWLELSAHIGVNVRHNIYKGLALALIISFLAFAAFPVTIFAQTTYSTDFETPTLTPGNVQGQNGWGYLGNSPTKGIIEAAPAGSPVIFGSASLAIRTNDVGFFGVSNHLYSAIIDPAGETGSTIGGSAVAAPYNQYNASFYYQAPATPVISTRADGRFAELDPSSKGTGAGDGANRYAQVRVFNDNNSPSGKVSNPSLFPLMPANNST